MNDMDYNLLCDAMTEHQNIKNNLNLTFSLINQKKHHLLSRVWDPELDDYVMYPGRLRQYTSDAREFYFHKIMFHRAIDLDAHDDSSLMVWYKVLSGLAKPFEYREFKMNSVDYRGNFNKVISNIKGLSPTSAFDLFSLDGWYTRLRNARIETLMRLSLENYEYIPDKNSPVGMNRRYEVIFIRFLLYLNINRPNWVGHMLVHNINGNTNIYARAYNFVKQIAYGDHYLSSFGAVPKQTALKPITETGFKRLCVNRELKFYWATTGPVNDPLDDLGLANP